MNLNNSALIRGALAGAVATLPMTMIMSKLFGELPREDKARPLPPGEITGEVERRAGVASQIDDRAHRKMTVASHFGFGALCGAIYTMTFHRLDMKPIVKGPVFGMAVWGISYMGWLPALGLAPAAWRESKQKNKLMIIAHLVWGASLARLALQDTRSLLKDAVAGATHVSKGSRWMERILA